MSARRSASLPYLAGQRKQTWYGISPCRQPGYCAKSAEAPPESKSSTRSLVPKTEAIGAQRLAPRMHCVFPRCTTRSSGFQRNAFEQPIAIASQNRAPNPKNSPPPRSRLPPRIVLSASAHSPSPCGSSARGGAQHAAALGGADRPGFWPRRAGLLTMLPRRERTCPNRRSIVVVTKFSRS